MLAFTSAAAKPEIEQQILAREAGICEQHLWQLQHKYSSPVWAMASTTPIHNSEGRYEGLIGLLTNITYMVQMQEALRISELQLGGILNSSLDVIMAFCSVRNSQGDIIDFEYLLANTSGCELTKKNWKTWSDIAY